MEWPPPKLLIGGRWIDGAGTVAVLDPADGRTLVEVATADELHADAAVEAAHHASQRWAATPPRQRAEILRRTFELMTAEADRLAELITRENGKVLADARAEIIYAAEFFRWFSEEAVRVTGELRTAPGGDKRILVTHQPVGVTVCITPWNFPAAMVTRKLAPALAAGTTTVVKPPTETPLTALAIAELLARAGLPDGVVNVIVPTDVGPVVDRMLHDERVRALSFTGSSEVGRLLLHSASDRVLRCSMELGGNAPFIVLDDADVDAAVDGAMVAKMRNGGAACTAANRFYVGRQVAEQFTSKLAARMGTLRLGHGLAPDTDLGALVSDRERDNVADFVESAIDDGATAVVGGQVPESGGAFYPATVLTDVTADAPILAYEIFGPVAPIVAIDDPEEAIARANDTEQGLVSYLYTGELRTGLQLAERLESGMVAVNRGLLSDPAAPFGGVKQSGLGREGGFNGIHEFLETKYIATDL